MPNTLLTPQMITREALRLLHNNLTFTKGVNRQYDGRFAKSGAKIGDTLDIRLPNRYTVRTGPTLAVQDTVEKKVSLVVNQQRGVDVQFSSTELTLSLDDFSERILRPAMARLATEIDFLGLAEYKNVYNQVGTPGTTPSTARVVLDAGVKLDNMATPRDNRRNLCVNPEAQASMVDALKGLFQDSAEVSRQYRMGAMGRALGFNWAMDQNVNVHTTGTASGYLYNAAGGSDGTNGLLSVDTGTGTFNAGDIITIAGVYSVNPENGQSTGQLMQFVVTQDYAGGAGDLSISPAIVTTGAWKNVDAAPADNAAITLVGSGGTQTPMNIAHHRDAFVLGTADLVLPRGVDFAAREVYDGISLRIVRQYDINTDNFPCRIDVLFGWLTARPEFACRIAG